MPLLDVTDVLADPMFADTFSVRRRTQSIAPGGIASDADVTIIRVGGVVEQNDIDLLRLDGGERLRGSITIYTQFPITDGVGQKTDADIVTYNGRDYTVASIEDWSRWGAGFIKGVAELLPLNP